MSDRRSYAPGMFACTIGDASPALIKSVKGGTRKGELALHKMGPVAKASKQVSGYRNEPYELQIAIGSGREMWDWMAKSFRQEAVPMHGEVVAADFNGFARAARVFTGALITEVVFPTLQADQTEPIYLTIKFDPETTRYENREGSKLGQSIGGEKTKEWQTANWRFRIANGVLPTTKVHKIESFTWKQNVAEDHVGERKECTKHPAGIEVPDIKITLSEADFWPWYNWADEYLRLGFNEAGKNLEGILEFLHPDEETVLGTLYLMGLGITSCNPPDLEANKDGISRFTVDLFCHDMDFNQKHYDGT